MRSVRVPLAEVLQNGSETESWSAVLDAAASKYIGRVLRLGAGATFTAFDPVRRVEADATVGEREGAGLRVEHGPLRPSVHVPTRSITLVQCVPKGDKLDAIVRDATELGATDILIAVSARSIAEKGGDGVMARLERVAIEAARQSGRGDVPTLVRPAPLAEVLAAVRAEVRLVLDPRATRSFDAVVGARSDASAAVLVGPEGGLDETELVLAASNGFEPAQLGRFTLRTETACAAALGALAARQSASNPDVAR